MVSIITANGLIQFEDAALTAELLKNQQAVEAKAKAEAAELSKSYSVKGLAVRLGISERNAYDLIRGGHIRYVCCGAKNYRVSEQAVREFHGDLKAVA
jgi:excisionase family DNA binding protein